MSRGGDTLRGWAQRAIELGAKPARAQAKSAIVMLLTRASVKRMSRGVAPDGTPFAPLAKSYVAKKRRAGRSSEFWVWSGQSKKRLAAMDGSGPTTRGVRLIINTPWSKAVHDGAVIRVRAHTASSLAVHAKLMKAGARRKREHNKRLKAIYGGKTAKQNRRAHALALREAASYRAKAARGTRQGPVRGRQNAFNGRISGAEAAAVKSGRAMRLRDKPRTSWTLRGRPVLGMSAEDEVGVGRILAHDAAERLEGKV